MNKISLKITCGLIASIIFIQAQITQAQNPGDLDLSFSNDGILESPISTDSEYAYGIAIQDDGKIVVAGYSDVTGTNGFVVARYLETGVLDEFFGDGGVTINPFGNVGSIASAVCIDDEGRIILAGLSDGNMAVARYLQNGTPDNEFGTNGYTSTDFAGEFDRAYDVSIQSTGKIVIAGYTGSIGEADFAFARYLVDGTLDLDFGTDGMVVASFGESENQATSLIIQPDDKIVAGGWMYNGLNTDFAMVRLLPDGGIDNSFHNDGFMSIDLGDSYEQIEAMALQDDGKFVVAGYSWLGSAWGFAVARFEENGNFDLDFGNGGANITSIGMYDDIAYSVVIEANGKIVLSGYTNDGSNYDFALVRYDLNGDLDLTFGDAGIVITPVGPSYDIIYASAIQSDGKLVVAGYTYEEKSSYNFGIARYHLSDDVGIFETEIFSNGYNVYPNPISNEFSLAMEIVQDGYYEIHLTDVLGKQIVLLENGNFSRGRKLLTFDLNQELNRGVYLLRISCEGKTDVLPILK